MQRKLIEVFLFFLLLLIVGNSTAQKASVIASSPIMRIDPPNWWVGMKDKKLQLCVYGKNVAKLRLASTYPGFKIEKLYWTKNPNYLFIDVDLTDAVAGKAELSFTDSVHTYLHVFQLNNKDSSTKRIQGFDSHDLVYLMMPDRFANGSRANDLVPNTNEYSIRRDSMFWRHGGDIKGIIDHLDYLKDLGITTLWLTPIQENNQPKASYHGYSFTDHYKVDPRLGDQQWYIDMVNKAHSKGLKVIMDMVYNHVGSEHWFIKDLPMPDWIHQFDTFTKTNYRAPALLDPYAADFDKNLMRNGWFAKTMPDLNQQNPYLARYLIQNSIWWIESTGIDGFRIDTYTYSDAGFMQDLMKKVFEEYPQFGCVGELWDHGVGIESYFMQHPKVSGVPDTHLPGLTDFQLYYAINEALTKQMGWTEGLARIYYTLAQDYLYSEATKNLLFLDNHDLSRFYSSVGEDIRKYKMGIAFLLTMRGIPSLYYGTEVLMKNFANPDGLVREDFKGGWQGDKENKFTKQGRTALENEAFEYVKQLANYRKTSEVLQTGKLMQFVPENNVYVYFRYNDKSSVMVILHTGDKPYTLHLSRFAERLKGMVGYTDIMSGEKWPLKADIELKPFEAKVLEMK